MKEIRFFFLALFTTKVMIKFSLFLFGGNLFIYFQDWNCTEDKGVGNYSITIYCVM